MQSVWVRRLSLLVACFLAAGAAGCSDDAGQAAQQGTDGSGNPDGTAALDAGGDATGDGEGDSIGHDLVPSDATDAGDGSDSGDTASDATATDDAAIDETATDDTATDDTATDDTATDDAKSGDAESGDAAETEADASDAMAAETGPADAAPLDTSAADVGAADTDPADAGTADTGTTDTLGTDPDASAGPGSDVSTADTSELADVTPELDGADDAAPADAADTLTDDGAADTVDAVAPPVTLSCGQSGLRIVDVRPWAGGGHQVVVGLPAGVTWTAGPPQLAPVGATASDGSFASAPPAAGWSLVVVVPSADTAAHAERLAAAAALVVGLPAGERIGLVTVDATGALPVLLDLAEDRPTLLSQLSAIPPAAAPTPTDTALQTLAEQLADTGDRWAAADRELFVVAGSLPELWSPFVAWPGAVGLRWLVAAETTAPAGLPEAGSAAVASWEAQEPDAAASTLLAALATARSQFWRLGFCVGGAKGAATIQWGSTVCPLTLPKPLEHLATDSCAAEAAAGDAWQPSTEIEFQLTSDQEAVWQDYYNTLNEADFALSVRLGEGAFIPAAAHFRGQSSMGCKRKNYKVDLEGGADRRLFATGGSDEFMLISMCLDVGYLNQVFANRLLAEQGLFPLQHRYVRLRKNGQNQGVYLLLQDPEDALKHRQLGLLGLVRRTYEPDVNAAPEVKFPNDPVLADAMLQDYQQMGIVAKTGPEAQLPELLSELVDTRLYWRWMAAMTLLGNGDYADETFFYAMQEQGGLRWRPMGWDADDLFSICHHNAEWALPDPHQMLFCAESNLDHALVRSEVVYADWAQALDLLIASWDDAHAGAVMAAALAELQALLDDETAIAMVEATPPFADGAAAKAYVAGRASKILTKLAASRSALTTKLASWEAGQP